jgi:type 1 glutamine amidotransferase
MNSISSALKSVGMFLLGFSLAAPAFAQSSPKRVLIIGQGPDGHPYGAHEFMPGARVVEKLLASQQAIQTTVVKADEPWPEGPALLDKADGIVLLVTQGSEWMQIDPARYAAIKRLAARQGGIVALHWSVGAKDEKYIAGQLELLGGTRGGSWRKYTVVTNDVKLLNSKHPILTGLKDFRVHDEFYYKLELAKSAPGFTPLMSTRLDDNDETICWAFERPDGGRSFGFVCVHFHKNWEREDYRRLAVQATLWSLKLPVPKKGVNVDIDPKVLELPPPPPATEKKKKSTTAKATGAKQ